MSTIKSTSDGSRHRGAVPDGALNLEGDVFWRNEIFDREMDRLFSSMWLCVGRTEDVAEVGDFLTREIGPDSVVVTMGDDGKRVAFFNVCRHRGTRLLDEACGRGLRRIVCPYHAWTYDGHGRLLKAPHMEDSESFRREDHGLVSVGCEVWHGFVFVNLAPSSGSLAGDLGDFPDVSGYGLGSLRRGARRDYTVRANWKILCENYSECYHCGPVHPHLHRLSDGSGPRNAREGVCFNGGPMSLRDGVASMTLTGESPRSALPGLRPDQRQVVEYFVVYPNLLLSLHPDYVLTHSIWPVDTGESRVVCEWLFAEDEVAAADFDPEDAVEFWDLTNRQDWSLCEGVQRGVQSRGHRAGRYQRREDCVFFFDRWYRRKMGIPNPMGESTP